MKFLIYLANIGLCASTSFYGRSGKTYRFTKDNERRLLVYQGPLTGAEFDAVAKDIFEADRDQNIATPCVLRVGEEDSTPNGELQMPVLPANARPSEMMTFASQIGDLQAQVAALTKENEALKAENYELGLKAAYASGDPQEVQRARFAENAPAPQPVIETPAPAPEPPRRRGRPAKEVPLGKTLPPTFTGAYDPDAVIAAAVG